MWNAEAGPYIDKTACETPNHASYPARMLY